MVTTKQKHLKVFVLSLILIVCANVMASFIYTRFDFTSEKRFTLSTTTKDILQKVDKPITITVFLEGDFPSGFKRLKLATYDLLSDFKSYSNGQIAFKFIDPSEGKSEEEKQSYYANLASKGIEATNLSVKTEAGLTQKIIFPAALVNYEGKEIAVKLLQSRMGLNPEEVLNNSVQNLEYAFISAIKKVLNGGKTRIAFTEGHGELSELQLQDGIKSLSEGFDVGFINLKKVNHNLLKTIGLLIVAKPQTAFSEEEKFRIDEYIMQGGKVFWAIDKVNGELDSLRTHGGQQLASGIDLNLDDQFFKYGIRINYDLIGDLNCGQIPVSVGNVGGEAQIQMVPWVFNPIIMPLVNHPIVKNLEGLKLQFANTIDVINTKNVRKTILLTTSPFNRELKSPSMISLDMIEDTPDPKLFQSNPKAVCVLLEGNFASDFYNRSVPKEISENVQIVDKSKATKMLFISDGDILRSDISEKDGSVFPLGYDKYMQQNFGNKNFLLNAADYLTDDAKLINIRTKEIKLRLLDKGRLINEKVKFQIINTILPIAMILVLAIFQHIYRRKKYAA